MSDERYELPEGWAWTSLGEIIEFKYGKGLPAKRRNSSGNIPVYGSNGTVGHHDKALAGSPAIVVGRKGSVGEVHISSVPCWPIDTTYFVDHFPSGLDATFLFRNLKSQRIRDLDRSTAVPGINREDLYRVPLPLPPLSEQRRIVAKIEALFEQSRTARQALDRIPPLLKKFRQSVLAAAFRGDLTRDWREQHSDVEPASALLERIRTERRSKWEEDLRAKGKDPSKAKYEEPKPLDTADLSSLPEGWTYTSVREVSRTIQYGYTQSGTSEPIGPKFLRITDIQNGRVDWEKVPYCEISEGEKAKYALGGGDIVFARSGATTGKSYLIRECPPSVFASYLIRVQPFPQVLPEYLYAFFQTVTYWDQITTRGNAQPNANAQVLGSVTFPLAPISEQQQIVSRIEDLFARADAIETAAETAKRHAAKLDQSILDRAFRGELVPQDPNDESAAVLLQRTR